jgi:asparaginyl-tRNA synthetase
MSKESFTDATARNLESFPGWGLGIERVSRPALRALTRIRAQVLCAIRRFFEDAGVSEVTTATLTQMSGSCENPATLFSLRYYDQTAYLAQSAQLQLEVLVGMLNCCAYTLTTSYRAENYGEDVNSSRRLSEFTLIEAEGPDWDLDALIRMQEDLIGVVLRRVLAHVPAELTLLAGGVEHLAGVRPPFPRITHADASQLLASAGVKPPPGGVSQWDFGIHEEQTLIRVLGGGPVFLTHHPRTTKYFNIRQKGDVAVSVDLLTPPLGETSGGAERESDPQRTAAQLASSRMLQRIQERGGNASEFNWYLSLLHDPGLPPRAGFGLGLERLIGFLINSNDILRCLEFPRTHRHLFP